MGIDIPGNLHVVLILTVGFGFASLFGYLAQRIHLSPIVGYLFAGYLIGPYSPGFVADLPTAEQLAEIGVILMMFGVGLHFKWQDLYNVKRVAIPGAIIQTSVTALVCIAFLYYLGWSVETGLVLGLCVGVASTVVLVRILSDHDLLNSPQGHIAVGWLIVEDVLTVLALLLLPLVLLFQHGESPSLLLISQTTAMVLFKFFLMAGLVLTAGKWLVAQSLLRIARVRMEELFTITVLALIFVIAFGTTLLFGTSIALGAFAAGMVIGQTVAKHQALANALPLRNTFAVVFFLSVGMLFKPLSIWENLGIFCGVLAIVLVIKPLAALSITSLLRYPFKTSLVVAIALAQIGEFSFILAEEALNLEIFPDEAYDIIVACAIVSIALNPLLFKGVLSGLEMRITQKGRITGGKLEETLQAPRKKAVVVGFGPVGKRAVETLEAQEYEVLIIDQNIDTINEIHATNRKALYGDATSRHILEAAEIKDASLLVITSPQLQGNLAIVHLAGDIHHGLHIISRTRYERDKKIFEGLGVQVVCCEEEAARALAQLLS